MLETLSMSVYLSLVRFLGFFAKNAKHTMFFAVYEINRRSWGLGIAARSCLKLIVILALGKCTKCVIPDPSDMKSGRSGVTFGRCDM